MSYLKDLAEAHTTIKGLAATLVSAPFWYLSIYLFDKKFYGQPMDIKLVFCFCITLVSVTVLAIVRNLRQSAKYTYKTGENVKIDILTVDAELYKATVVNIIDLSVLTIIVYSIKFFTGFQILFFNYIMISLLPILYNIFMFLVYTAKSSKREIPQ